MGKLLYGFCFIKILVMERWQVLNATIHMDEKTPPLTLCSSSFVLRSLIKEVIKPNGLFLKSTI